MERRKKAENITDMKENGATRIPKSTEYRKFSSAKETRSKVLTEKKSTQSLKTAEKVVTTSSKQTQEQISSIKRNVKRVSVVKISKDVMDQFQIENLKSEDNAIGCSSAATVLNKESTTQRAPLKEKFSQTSQKQPGGLSKIPSATDCKQSAAFAGIRFNAKRNNCRKFDLFQKMSKESKDRQAVNLPEPCTEEQKTTDTAKAISSKEIERSNEGNSENPSSDKAAHSKAVSITKKEATLKKCAAFGGIRFKPKWHSTPFKPDLFENLQSASSHEKELHPPELSDKFLEKIPNSAKAITKEKDETLQPPTKEPKYLETAYTTLNETGDKIFTAFAGIPLTPKRKSTHPKPDIFERVKEELKSNYQESHASGTSSDHMKISTGATMAISKTETQSSLVEKLEHLSIQNLRLTETVSITVKETNLATAFEGIRFAPKWKSTPIRPMLDSVRKEWESDSPETHPSDSSNKELKMIPVSTMAKIKIETQHSDVEKLELPATKNPVSSKNDDIKKNEKKVGLQDFGGIRFKPRQKNLPDVFGGQKTKVSNQKRS